MRKVPSDKAEDDLMVNYGDIATRVCAEIAALGKDSTFAYLTEIDVRLGLPKGTAFEVGGFAAHFAFAERG